MKAKTIRVVVVREDQSGVVETVLNDLKTFQGIVEGYIECPSLSGFLPRPECDGLDLVCNEEGLFDKNPVWMFQNATIHGNFFIARVNYKTGEYVDLTDKDVKFLTGYFKV